MDTTQKGFGASLHARCVDCQEMFFYEGREPRYCPRCELVPVAMRQHGVRITTLSMGTTMGMPRMDRPLRTFALGNGKARD